MSSINVSASASVFIETHSLVRERTFRDIDAAIRILHVERATGKLVVNVSNGTVCSMQFEERQRLQAGPR